MSDPRAPQFVESLLRSEAKGEANVYALLDSARRFEVFQAVRWSARPSASLYAGSLPEEIERVAPYVVELGGDHSFTRRVITEGWGDSWGYFVVTNADLKTLRAHLRSLLRVRTDEGRRLLFRFYDPRVLRVYLPTCTRQELATFFGPITRFLVEDETAGAALTYEQHHGEIAISRREIA